MDDYASIYAAEMKSAKQFSTKRLLDGIGWRLDAKRFTGLQSMHLEASIDAATDVLMERGICADVGFQLEKHPTSRPKRETDDWPFELF